MIPFVGKTDNSGESQKMSAEGVTQKMKAGRELFLSLSISQAKGQG